MINFQTYILMLDFIIEKYEKKNKKDLISL